MGCWLIPFLVSGFADSGVDLAAIAKQVPPPKSTKALRYACLVFGEGPYRVVWLGLGSGELYVDRDSNGDFAGTDKRIAERRSDDGLVSTFSVGELSIPDVEPNNLVVTVTHLPQTQGGDRFNINIRVRRKGAPSAEPDGRYFCYAAEDESGRLLFTERPDDAPILHIGGPWKLMLDSIGTATRGRDVHAYFSVATMGRGRGTRVSVGSQDGAPNSAMPTVQFLNGGPSVKIRHRC